MPMSVRGRGHVAEQRWVTYFRYVTPVVLRLRASWIVAWLLADVCVAGCNVVGFGPGSAVDPAPGKGACALASSAELATITGMTVAPGESNDVASTCDWSSYVQPTQTPGSGSFAWNGVEIGYAPSAASLRDLDEVKNAYRGDRNVLVRGIGDEAMTHTSIGSAPITYVRHGRLIVYVAVSDPGANTVELETRIAALIAGRIHP
jgi:hypothetical protein